ncbi:Eukaryotic translation initiation factor 3 subunit J [Sparganum proliferum]
MDDWEEEDLAVKAAPSTWDDDANDVPPLVDLDTLKDVSTFIGALIVEKQKLAKGKTKKKAGKTSKLIVERKNDYDYDMGGDEDFDDFI